MKSIFYSVFCCSKGICCLQNLILNTDMSHLTCIESSTHRWRPEEIRWPDFMSYISRVAELPVQALEGCARKGTTVSVFCSLQAAQGRTRSLHLKHKLHWPQHFTLSFAHHITGCFRWEGTSENDLVQPLLKAGPPTASCSGPCPVGFWISQRMETPQALWATCTSV